MTYKSKYLQLPIENKKNKKVIIKNLAITLIFLVLSYLGYSYYSNYKLKNSSEYILSFIEKMPYELGRELSNEEKSNAIQLKNTEEYSNIIASMIERDGELSATKDKFYKIYHAYKNNINFNEKIDQFDKARFENEYFAYGEKIFPLKAQQGSKHKYIKDEIIISFHNNYNFDKKGLPIYINNITNLSSNGSYFLIKRMTDTNITKTTRVYDMFIGPSERIWSLSEKAAKEIINKKIKLKGIAYYDISKSKISEINANRSNLSYAPGIELLAYCVQIDFYSKNNSLLFSTGCKNLNVTLEDKK